MREKSGRSPLRTGRSFTPARTGFNQLRNAAGTLNFCAFDKNWTSFFSLLPKM